MKYILFLHLVNGETLSSIEFETSEDELTKFKDLTEDVFTQSGPGGFIRAVTKNGWVCVPKAAILYIQIEETLDESSRSEDKPNVVDK